MSHEEKFEERARAILHNLGVTASMTNMKLVVDALRHAYEEGRDEADSYDPDDE